MKKELSHGKKLGLSAFVMYEIIIGLIVVEQILNIFFGSHTLDSNIVIAVLTSQGVVFSVVWGTKAVSNFAPKGDVNAQN
jgi:hypothetical protein